MLNVNPNSKIVKTPDPARHTQPQKAIKVALISCGLGYVNRGFEVSTARLFEAVRQSPSLDVRLFSGGRFQDATAIPNLPRDFLLNTVLRLAALFNRRRVWEFAYGCEQVTFALGLLPELLKWQPDVVWTKEAPFAHVLLTLRTLCRLRFKIVFANGGGFRPSTYEPFDCIQHLQSSSFDDAIAYGISPAKMTVLPNLLPTDDTQISRQAARASFGLRPEDWVVVSVAAWNRYHKRIDYLIEEVASIQDKNTRLLLCGHPEPDAGSLKALARQRLGDKVQWHTLPKEDVVRLLKAGDVFVLASTNESFGTAIAEAALCGLPIVIHPHAASRLFIEHGFQATDLSEPGALARRLSELKAKPPSTEETERLSSALRAYFNEPELRQKFAQMMQNLAVYE